MVLRLDAAVLNPEDCVLIVAMLPDGQTYVQVAGAVTPAEVAGALRNMADRFDAEGITEDEPIDERHEMERWGEPELGGEG